MTSCVFTVKLDAFKLCLYFIPVGVNVKSGKKQNQILAKTQRYQNFYSVELTSF